MDGVDGVSVRVDDEDVDLVCDERMVRSMIASCSVTWVAQESVCASGFDFEATEWYRTEF